MTTTTDNKAKLAACRLLYEEGASDVEVAAEMGITLKRFEQMYQDYPQFTEFVDLGRTLAQAWWYKLGRTKITFKGFNAAVYALTMKNRYGWADKIDTSTQDTADLNLDQLRSQLAKQMDIIANKHPELLQGAKGVKAV